MYVRFPVCSRQFACCSEAAVCLIPKQNIWKKLNLYEIEIQRIEIERETINKKLSFLVEPKTIIELTLSDAQEQAVEDVQKAWKLR